MAETYVVDGLIKWKNEIDTEIKAAEEDETRLKQGIEILHAKLQIISYSKGVLQGNAEQKNTFFDEYGQPIENEIDELEKELASKKSQFQIKRRKLSAILKCIEGYIKD